MSPRTPLTRTESTTAALLLTLCAVLAVSSCTPQHDTCAAWRAAAERRTADVLRCAGISSCRLTLEDIQLENWTKRREDKECRL